MIRADSPAVVAARTPVASVVMTAYNALDFVADALDSVLAQTLRDFELLVVDDASTDGTQAVVERYARRDRRIRVLRLTRNVGTARAKNIALGRARAPYVAICDDDDRQRPERLALQVESLEQNPQRVMVGGRVHPFGDVGDAPIGWLAVTDALARPRVLFQALYIDSANMFRRDLARLHGIAYPAGLLWDDWVFQAQALRIGEIHVLPQVLLDYRRHPAQQTSPQRLTESGLRTRETMRAVLNVAGVACSPAELALHHAISPSPFGLVAVPDHLLRQPERLIDDATVWLERLGQLAVFAGWTSAAAFREVAAMIVRHLRQTLAAALQGAASP